MLLLECYTYSHAVIQLAHISQSLFISVQQIRTVGHRFQGICCELL